MDKIPGVIATARQTIGKPPRVKVETAIRQTEGAIGFYTDELFTLAGEPPGRGRARARRPTRSSAALKDYLGVPRERGAAPVRPTPGGSATRSSRKKLELELDAGLTADEVLAEAEREARRVEREMDVIARQLWGTTLPRRADPARRRRGPPRR